MKESKITLGRLFEFASRNLPPGWELRLTMTAGETTLSLTSEDREATERCQDDMDTCEMIVDYVNYARKIEGLKPVSSPLGGESSL